MSGFSTDGGAAVTLSGAVAVGFKFGGDEATTLSGGGGASAFESTCGVGVEIFSSAGGELVMFDGCCDEIATFSDAGDGLGAGEAVATAGACAVAAFPSGCDETTSWSGVRVAFFVSSVDDGETTTSFGVDGTLFTSGMGDGGAAAAGLSATAGGEAAVTCSEAALCASVVRGDEAAMLSEFGDAGVEPGTG